MNIHRPVLLEETLSFLDVKSGQKYIDATFGGGGHSRPILERGGLVLGIDLDKEAISQARHNFEKEINDSKLFLAEGNFKNINEIAGSIGFSKVSGILFDLGFSSNQLEDPNRGLSYLKDGPLDMRLDQNLSVTAADLLKVLGENELYELFIKFGEERRARAISNGIVSARRIKEMKTTNDLVDLLMKINKVKGDSSFMKAKVSKKVFQALRIAVNDELGSLKEVLDSCPSLLQPRAKLAVISFHSLEDRVVKEAFVRLSESGFGSIITKKPVLPSILEVSANPRAKSAKLRVFEHI
jgi:16S rRNA (cytosine1402-N4)-methyltransferase